MGTIQSRSFIGVGLGHTQVSLTEPIPTNYNKNPNMCLYNTVGLTDVNRAYEDQ